MSRRLREIAAPFAAAAPAGARVRTRLRLAGDDAQVLREAGKCRPAPRATAGSGPAGPSGLG